MSGQADEKDPQLTNPKNKHALLHSCHMSDTSEKLNRAKACRSRGGRIRTLRLLLRGRCITCCWVHFGPMGTGLACAAKKQPSYIAHAMTSLICNNHHLLHVVHCDVRTRALSASHIAFWCSWRLQRDLAMPSAGSQPPLLCPFWRENSFLGGCKGTPKEGEKERFEGIRPVLRQQSMDSEQQSPHGTFPCLGNVRPRLFGLEKAGIIAAIRLLGNLLCPNNSFGILVFGLACGKARGLATQRVASVGFGGFKRCTFSDTFSEFGFWHFLG